jgi:hypothetical protein
MNQSVTDWVAAKLVEGEDLDVVSRTSEGFLVVSAKRGYEFKVAVLGEKDVIRLSNVEFLFASANRPQFVVNVPSKALWTGEAICCIHAAPAGFGTLGDVSRAAATGRAETFRDKNMDFFIQAIRQHSNVTKISYVYDCVFKADQRNGKSVTVAVIDAYNMSAEDVRNAKIRFGHFDVIVKSSSHGSITHQAEAAAGSIGAEALTFGELMKHLAK